MHAIGYILSSLQLPELSAFSRTIIEDDDYKKKTTPYYTTRRLYATFSTVYFILAQAAWPHRVASISTKREENVSWRQHAAVTEGATT